MKVSWTVPNTNNNNTLHQLYPLAFTYLGSESLCWEAILLEDDSLSCIAPLLGDLYTCDLTLLTEWSRIDLRGDLTGDICCSSSCSSTTGNMKLEGYSCLGSGLSDCRNAVVASVVCDLVSASLYSGWIFLDGLTALVNVKS